MITAKLFEDGTIEVFSLAGVDKSEAPELFEEYKALLMEHMALLSATMGMSYRRVESCRERKNILAEELRKLKTDGALR